MVEAREVSSDLTGSKFGPYRIVRRLGVGGMAETFEAVRSGPGEFSQRVCLKLALPFLREDPEFVRLFQREARLAAKLRHGNIVGVLDYGSVDDTPYMALELVDGVDLARLLEAQRRLAFEHAALLAVELAKGLSHAHTPPSSAGLDDSNGQLQGIVHRDLSPSNVMLSHQGEVMLTDFGVAKAMSGASRLQSAVKGKVPYMSPEQLRNEALDGRADLFSLGVVLFETLSGRRPFDGGNDPATIMRILEGDHVPLAELARGAPERFCEVVDRLLEPERDDRPSSAAELIEQLDEFAPSPRVQTKLGEMVAQVTQELGSKASDEPPDAFVVTLKRNGEIIESGVDVVDVDAQSEPRANVAGDAQPHEGFHLGFTVALFTTVFAGLVGGIVFLFMRFL